MNLDIVNSWAEEEEKRRKGKYGTSGTVDNSTATGTVTPSSNISGGTMNLDMVNEWGKSFATQRAEEKMKEEMEKPRKEYQAKVQEFDTQLEQAKNERNFLQKIFRTPSKKEKELAGQKAEFVATTYNKRYTQEEKDAILAQKPKDVKLSDEQYISLRADVDNQLKYLNSVKAITTQAEESLNNFQQWQVKQNFDGKEIVRNTPFLPTKELVAQSNTYNTQTDWTQAYDYLKKAAKESGMSEEEYAKSYNAQISGQMLDIYKKVVGDASLTKDDIINTTRRTGIPAVDDNQIRIEIENINQYLDKAKGIYDEYTGVKEVDKVDNIKEGLEVARDKILGGTAPFVGDLFNSNQEGLLDIAQLKQLEQKLANGEKLTTAETARIVLTSALETNQQIDRGWKTRVAQGTPEALKMMGEMAATYGIFNAAQTAVKTTAVAATRKISYSAAKEIVEAAASETGKTWIRTLATKGAKEGLKQIMGGVAVAMVAEIPETIAKDSLKIATEVMNNNRPVISFSDPETEEEFISIVKSDEEYESDWVNDLTKAFARQYFNNVLERGAGEVPDAIIAEGADKLKGLVIAKYMSQKGIQTLEEFQKVYDAVGLQGMFGEVFEEYAQDYTESIIDNRDFVIDDPDKFWDIVAQVGVLQLGRAGSVATTAIDVTSNIARGITFDTQQQTDQQVPAVEGEAPVDTRTGQDLDTLITNTQTGESVQDDLQTKEILRQQQVSGETQTVLTEPVDDATLLRKAQALSDISKQTDYSLSSLTELKKLEKQATDEKTAQAIATISSSYADVLAKKVADGSVNIGQQIDTQLQDNIKEISPDETVQEGIKTTKQQILETPNKEYFVQEKGKFKEIKDAQSIKIINEADTFIYRDPESKLYQVVEAKSGMAIAEASTKSAAIEQATARLNKMGLETFQSKIQEVISKKGISPRYIKKEVKKETKKSKSTKTVKKSVETKKEQLVEDVAQEAKRIQDEAIEDQTRGLIEDAKRLNKEDFIEQFGYLFEGDELSPYTETVEEFYNNATGEKSPIEKAGLKIGSKIKVQGKLREVSEFGKSARDSQGVLVRFTDGTYITLDKAQEYAAQKQTKDAIKKESTEKTKEAVKEAEETVRKLEKEKKVDQNQLAKRRMGIGKTNPEVKKISKDLKDFQESEDYVALKDEYKILLKEARLTHSTLESYIDTMVEMYGEEAATYLEDFMQRWTAAQAAIQTLTDSKSEIINNQLREEGFNLPKYRTYRPADQRELVVIRNMSREAVRMAIDNGGMPVPSVAITKYDIPFVDFGEISFIGAADMVDPESGEVKVLTSDAWTPTVPEKEYKVSDYRKVLTDAEIKFLEKFDVVRWLDLESTSEHERKNAVITVDQMEEGKDKVRARELVDKVMGEPFVTLKNPKPQGLLGRAIKENAAIRKIWKESRSFYDFNLLYENEAETIDIMDAYAKELYPEDGDDAFYNPEFEKQLSLEYEIQKPYNNSEALAEKIMQDIDLYNEGDVRSNKGFSPLRAKIAREFTSIQDIIDQSDRLKAKPTEEEAKNMDMKTKTDFIFDAIQSLPEADQKYFMDWNRDFTKWERLDGVLAGWKKITKAKLTEFLFNESGGYMRDDELGRVTYQKPSMDLVKKFVSNIDIKQMDEYYENEYRNPKTDMFEAKILRNVLLEEWKGAVVPNDIDPQLKKAIKDAGGRMFKLYEYDPAKPETRQEAIENFKDYRFKFETEHERITGEKASQETIDKIMKMNKKFFGDENVRVVESLMSEDGQKVYGRYLAGWTDLLNDKKQLEPTYYHEAGHKGLELIGQADPKRVEKILDEVIETKGIANLQIKWGNYAPDTIAKYLYETARRQGIRRYDDIVSMKDIERNLAILKADQRKQVERKFNSLEKERKELLKRVDAIRQQYDNIEDFAMDENWLVRMGKIDRKGGAYFATSGASTYYDPLALETTRNTFLLKKDTKIVETDTDNAKEVIRKALEIEKNKDNIEQLKDILSDGHIDYIDNDGIPSIVNAAKELGYDGIKVWESDDFGNPSSIFLWNTEKILNVGSMYDAWDGNEKIGNLEDQSIYADIIARYRGATNEDNAYIWAEEELAENFIDYVQGRETFTGQIKQFFDDLLEFIKSLVGAESQVKKLYREIYTGKLSTKQMDSIQKQYVPNYRDGSSNTLIAEARKYKSADEFIKAQGEVLYHGTPFKFSDFKKGKTTFFTPDRKFAEDYGYDKSFARELDADIQVLERYGKLNIFDSKNKDHVRKIKDLLPKEIDIMGAMAGMGARISKSEFLERIQGVFTHNIPKFAEEATKVGEIFNDMSIKNEGYWRIKEIKKNSVIAEKIEDPYYAKDKENLKIYKTEEYPRSGTYKEYGEPYWKDFEGDQNIEDVLKKAGFDGYKMTEKDSVTYGIFNPEKLLSKSQLIDIWNESQKIKPKYRADLLFDEEVEEEVKDVLFEYNDKTREYFEDEFKGKAEVLEAIDDLGGIDNVQRETTDITRLEATETFDVANDGVQRVIEEIKSGVQVPLIASRLENGNYLIQDGNHRLVAYKELGITQIPIITEKTIEVKSVKQEAKPVEEETPKKPKKEKPLEITKTPEAGVVYDVKGSSILPSRKLQQQIEETLMSGQSTPATRSITAFMPVIETAGKIKDSRAFEKIQDRYAEIQELDPSLNELKYQSMSIADITAKAMAFVDEYPAEARRVALGMELAPEGTTNIAVSLAYTEKMFEEGKWKQAREADRALSLRGTRLGQEIVSFKGRLNANSPMFFMEQVLNARRMVVSSRMFKSGSLENFAKMKQERMAEVAKTLKQIKLEKAEDFINKLIC